MSEREEEVRTFRIDYWCDECTFGEMVFTGQAITTDVTRYHHKCDKCGAVNGFLHRYPRTAYRPIVRDEMTDRPILFKPEMIREILDNRKHQTRRILTRRNTYYDGDKWPKKDFAYIEGGHDEYQWDKAFVDGGPSPAGNPGPYLKLPVDHCDSDGTVIDHTTHRIYPRVQVGDFFWCKEAWAHDAPDDETFKACHQDAYSDDYSYGPYYKATAEQFDIDSLHWKPARYMPKYVTRLWLKVNQIRIERVQQISEADAIAEGCMPHGPGLCTEDPDKYWKCWSAKTAFRNLWNSIHKDKHPWENNDWVTVYDFERVKR
jgi:hypothetical protein